MDGCKCTHVYMCACLCCVRTTTLDFIPQMSSTFCRRVFHCPGSCYALGNYLGGSEGTSKTGREVMGQGIGDENKNKV